MLSNQICANVEANLLISMRIIALAISNENNSFGQGVFFSNSKHTLVLRLFFLSSVQVLMMCVIFFLKGLDLYDQTIQNGYGKFQVPFTDHEATPQFEIDEHQSFLSFA